MDIETFKKATEIYSKLEGVNELIRSITVGDTQSQTFRYRVSELVRSDPESFLIYLNGLRVELETEFNELHCECPPVVEDENSTEQENPKS
jgi:hypothetical protein